MTLVVIFNFINANIYVFIEYVPIVVDFLSENFIIDQGKSRISVIRKLNEYALYERRDLIFLESEHNFFKRNDL